MAAVLATPTAADFLDNPDYDATLLAIWTFIAGGLYGAVGYFVIGFAVFFGVRLLGSLGGFRRARQIVGFALAARRSLLVTLPLRLAIYGGDTFRGGRGRGLGGDLLLGLQLGAAAWSLALLASACASSTAGSWLRTLGSLVAAVALLAAIVGVFAML